MELTFIMIKPDGVQGGLIGEIISGFQQKGFILKAMKLVQIKRLFAEKHYEDMVGKPFFGGLVEYVTSRPIVAMVWCENGVVQLTGRKMLGATKLADSAHGTIKGDFVVDVKRNVIHGSDFVERSEGDSFVIS
ncbi:hypothetical protein L7F22_040512 [Adiantum nelumboides]|nr:hypothetical protein [Adiantum nelumboides]